MIKIKDTVEVLVNGTYVSVNDLIEENKRLNEELIEVKKSFELLVCDISRLYDGISSAHKGDMGIGIIRIMEIMDNE